MAVGVGPQQAREQCLNAGLGDFQAVQRALDVVIDGDLALIHHMLRRQHRCQAAQDLFMLPETLFMVVCHHYRPREKGTRSAPQGP